jgi:drug/metabolite transporter (DMT)-like permease
MSPILYAIAAAALFGVATPLAKLLTPAMSPWLLAGWLYLGSGVGLAIVRALAGRRGASIARTELPWLIGAIASGGIAGPLLLMWGLQGTSGSSASLLLNAEAVFTALIAWFVFRENFDRRIALGMLLIVAGAAILASPGSDRTGWSVHALGVLGACLAWGIDNNLTRKVSLADATTIAMLKGLVAGAVNVGLGLALGDGRPSSMQVAATAVLGFFSYGVSLVLFVKALRGLGTARTSAYFSTAPFVGVVASFIVLREAPAWGFFVALVLMAAGVWLHVSERHAHRHTHPPMDHEHEHVHDEHHQHAHGREVDEGEPHSHPHHHEGTTHSHAHYPDAHHRHRHS